MSKYCWENGTIVIPRAAWPGFKKNLREAWNLALDKDFETMTTVYDKLKAAYKGKRNVDWNAALYAELYKVHSSQPQQYRSMGPSGDVYKFKVLEQYLVEGFLLTPRPKPVAGTSAGTMATVPFVQKLVLPKKSALPYANSKTTGFQVGECSISLSSETAMSVTWDVPENNHAVDGARDTHIASVFFSLLSKVQWTRNSGGTISGNDEYNTESRGSGEGSNYSTGTFGPIGASDKEMSYRRNGFSAKDAKQLVGQRR